MATVTERFAVSPNIYSTSDEDGSTILDVANDKIYSLIGVSSLIWAKLAASSRGLMLHNIVDYVSDLFQEVPRQTIEADAAKLLESLRTKGMITAGAKDSYIGSRISKSICRSLIFLARLPASVLLRLRLHTFTAFLGIAMVNLVLRVLGFQMFCEAIKSWPINDRPITPGAKLKICEAVRKAGSWYPRQSMCLQRSAVTTCLLRQSGVAAELVIGCRKIPFGAHAWVEVAGEIANDKRQVQEFYKVLSRF
jgi:hypothetical protein